MIGSPNIYVIEDCKEVDYDNPMIIGTAAEWVLVEADLETASELSAEWKSFHPPMYASDGVWVTESGDEIYLAHGEEVESLQEVAKWLDFKGDGDPRDFLEQKGRIF